MPNTLIAIQTVTVGSGGTSSIIFTNIPQNYTDLYLVASVRDTRSDTSWTDGYLSINGAVSGTSHSYRYMLGDGSSPSAGAASSTSRIAAWLQNSAQSTANTFTNTSFYFPNYSNTSYNKSVSIDSAGETNNTYAFVSFVSGLWSSTAAISSLHLTPPYGVYAEKSTVTLYGISNGVKATGGTLTVAGGYAYHTFTSAGSFLPSQQIKGAEVLVVAGGGGGGRTGGGGGAGGLLYTSNQTLSAGNSYTVLVGAGGSGSNTDTVPGTQGGASAFLSLSCTGGGGGGSYNGNGGSGGSGGGGGAFDGSPAQTGGSGIVGQGNNGGGGASAGTVNRAAGGGGGAVAAGGGASSGSSGAGGVGTSAYSSWGAITGTGALFSGLYYYAGGGGGVGTSTTLSPGGLGGGGNGTPTTGTSGTALTGGGGGGGVGGSGSGGGSGGSGVVIVRYPLT
jgi:hypothetical protein